MFDVFREPHDGGTWVCRRDESLRLPYDAVIERTADGISYLVPELVMLFKAKATRPKDHADFDGALPLLSQARRDVTGWLTHVHPGHPYRRGWQSGDAIRAWGTPRTAVSTERSAVAAS